MALKRESKHTDMRSLVFDKTSFWVQVHNLPTGSFSMAVAKDIVSIGGMVDESETEVGDGEGCNFLRVQIAVNQSIPLCRGREIAGRDGSASWVNFKYEQLPNICYWCGRLTHHDKDCTSKLRRRGTTHVDEKQFGSWLRASTLNPSWRTVIRVAGFEEEVGEYDDFTASGDDESEVDRPSASPLALAPTSDTVREQDVAGPERGGFREDASVSDGADS